MGLGVFPDAVAKLMCLGVHIHPIHNRRNISDCGDEPLVLAVRIRKEVTAELMIWFGVA